MVIDEKMSNIGQGFLQILKTNDVIPKDAILLLLSLVSYIAKTSEPNTSNDEAKEILKELIDNFMDTPF